MITGRRSNWTPTEENLKIGFTLATRAQTKSAWEKGNVRKATGRNIEFSFKAG